MAGPVIALDDVHVSLGRGAARVHILKGVGLSVERGEAVGLTGPSGSGKSTLLMVLAGLERAQSGAVTVDGTRLDKLDHRLGHYPAQLSGGEQQRGALARALAPDPSIVVADEPTGNLDEATGRSITDLLFATRTARGATLVLVTHDSELAGRCDRQIRLRSGRIETEVDAVAARVAAQ